ncbi:MAG: UDP-N-acetylmuramate dehydrogenase [Sphingobacteriales bacterium]|nr:MAG: UDP-N-acetylmuramate dehydrogenase [Sphingobacteriales bacterium]
MQFAVHVDLKPYNTFGLAATAQYFAKLSSVEQLSNLNTDAPVLVLGGGSNLLFRDNINGFVVKNEIMGIDLIREDADHVYVRAGAGENWHGFVEHCIANGWCGVENLALIPGCVGASPMQNIGAYGVEIKDVFHSLEAWHLQDKELHSFSLEDCAFGYRESVFKRKYKGQYIITHVTYRLRKTPEYHISYGAIQQELEHMGAQELSIRAVADAVISIRKSKLPDPAVIGNAGSFFKNPEIPAETFVALKLQFPDIIGYPTFSGMVKLAAGWLIERAGWKGYRKGDAGVHAKQALVLVNYGGATGDEIFHLSEEILHSINAQFGVQLEREVNIIP